MKSSHKLSLVLLAFLILNYSFLISNCQAQWVQVSNGMGNRTVSSLACIGNNIFAGTMNYGVYLSTNNGANWTQTALNNGWVISLAVNENYVFAGGYTYYGVYVSSNNGSNWTHSFLSNRYAYSLAATGSYTFAGTLGYGVYLSIDNGQNWTQTSLNNQNVYSLAANGNNIFAGTNGNGIYLSTNYGTNWTRTSFDTLRVLSLAVNGNNVFAGVAYALSGVYISTNNGTTWTRTLVQNIFSLAVNGNDIFAGTFGNGVYISNDNGTNWTQRNEGIGNVIVNAFCILNNYVFAGTSGNSVYRRPLSEIIGIKPISSKIPSHFSLEQNYPNPFNPTTKVNFSLPGKSFVKLIIYDALGKTIVELVNEELNPGTYSVDWDASNFPSGIYFYQMTARDYKETKRMVLLR